MKNTQKYRITQKFSKSYKQIYLLYTDSKLGVCVHTQNTQILRQIGQVIEKVPTLGKQLKNIPTDLN